VGCTPRVHGASDSERHKAAIIQLAVDRQAVVVDGGSVGLPASPRSHARRHSAPPPGSSMELLQRHNVRCSPPTTFSGMVILCTVRLSCHFGIAPAKSKRLLRLRTSMLCCPRTRRLTRAVGAPGS
jgi:hypothetical protein